MGLKIENGHVKCDFIIGNPPYQDETVGDNKTYAAPIYDKYLDGVYEVARCVEMIHPARFLFNAGGTPKDWNRKMLDDPHLKVTWYEAESGNVFSNTNIMGGIAVTLRDENKILGPISIFTPFQTLNTILQKVMAHPNFSSLSDIVVTRTAYRLTEKMHQDYPEALSQLSNGHAYDMSTNIFSRLPQIFFDKKPIDGHEYIQILGRSVNERVYKYVRTDYVNQVQNLYKYKILLPKSNGSGAIGEVIPTVLIGQPLIGEPSLGHTETFISIGSVDTQEEAQAILKYVKSKFARTMLGILKITQDNTRPVWKYVPLQNFTPSSDIDWTKSVSEIDQQLYKKYGLDEKEIDFIESHVKEMA